MKPTATPQGSPERSTPKSGATKRPRMAAALSDVTNLLLPETPTPIKPRRTARRPLPQPSDASSTCSSSASVTPAPKRSSSASVTPAPKRSSSASVTPAPKRPSAAVLEEECSVFKSPAISTVYARRGTTQGRGSTEAPATNKGKAKAKETASASVAAGAASCPQLGKSARDDNRKTSMAQDTRPISSSAPCHEAKKKRLLSSTPKLPEDFVKEKREYFAAVDAFELLEEEVSETDLD